MTQSKENRTQGIVLIEIRRPSDADRYSWTPFEPDDRFTSEWWDQSDPYGETYSYVQVLLDGIEVARVELDESIDIGHYAGAPKLGATALEIQFIEVASDRTGQGIGSELVRRLEAANPTRRLVAFSEEADEFWSSLGWERYDHSEGPSRYRPLFVQRARSCPSQPDGNGSMGPKSPTGNGGDLIVSGGTGLFELGSHDEIPILSAREFVRRHLTDK